MLSPRDLWYYLPEFVRRQSQESTVPPECYDDCNAAAEAIRSEGRSSSLCDPDTSDFMTAIENCGDCLSSWASNPTSDAFNQIDVNLVSYAEYCHAPVMDESPDLSGLLSRVSTLAADAPIVEPTSSPTTETGQSPGTAQSTGSGADKTSTITSSSTPVSATSSDSSDGPPIHIIIPAVVVPVVCLGAAALIVVFILLRRHRRSRRAQMQAQTFPDPAAVEKNGDGDIHQLHSTDLKPELDTKPGVAARLEMDPGDPRPELDWTGHGEPGVEADSKELKPELDGVAATNTRAEMDSQHVWPELDATATAHATFELDSRDIAELPADSMSNGLNRN